MEKLSLQHPYLCRYYYGYNQYDSVRRLQEILNEKCLSNLSVDGYFGRATEEAVKEYQRINNLRVDGIVGPETLASLNMSKQNNAFIPNNGYNEGLLSGSDDIHLGMPISDIGLNMSSVDKGYESGLIQEEAIESTPLFKLGISYDNYAPKNSTIEILDLPEQSSFRLLNDRAFGLVSQLMKPVLIADMTKKFYEYINSLGLECSFNYNNYRDRYSIIGIELSKRSRQIVNTIRKVNYTFSVIDVDYWLGAQIGKRLLPILQKARPIFNTLLGINISTERINHLLHTANDIIADIINFLRSQVQNLNLMHFVNNQSRLVGLAKRVGELLKRFIPTIAKVVSSVAMFAQLLLHIKQGNKEKVLEDLLTIVKDIVIGVATTAAVSALMAVGLGEIAIAIVILFAILDYFFFNPDPAHSWLPTHNLIAECV